MIISASRRTDIPAFHMEWMMNRLRAGYCLVRNPMVANVVYRIDLDPSFRIAEEGEIKLLQQDVLAQMLEEEYEKAAELRDKVRALKQELQQKEGGQDHE